MDNEPKRLAVPASPYSYRPPSPPVMDFIAYPSDSPMFILEPSYDLVDPSQISRGDFAIVTGNRTQTTVEHLSRWRYEERREAQRILDFLYLGPTSVIRDHGFLRREAISMIVVARDARAPIRLASIDTASTTLGISVVYVDIQPDVPVKAFYKIVHHVNNHLLDMHRAQAGGGENSFNPSQQLLGQTLNNAGHGRVLVVCDSGNDLSPVLVAAYIMSMFGQSAKAAIQYVNVQRFCACFDEESKRTLITWEGIIKASASVATHSQSYAAFQMQDTHVVDRANTKRGLADFIDTSEEDDQIWAHESVGDRERFNGREAFAPFMEFDG
ncbi:fmi2 [Trichoderma arundinaceum]|uniref:Fmi2 n=1 Tax=Trichoderma arundinaceum TaxID=490622 RepID=A0A395NLY9_TRIAR|nr:fmi2 [Trichoderma arundinaceum]